MQAILAVLVMVAETILSSLDNANVLQNLVNGMMMTYFAFRAFSFLMGVTHVMIIMSVYPVNPILQRLHRLNVIAQLGTIMFHQTTLGLLRPARVATA